MNLPGRALNGTLGAEETPPKPQPKLGAAIVVAGVSEEGSAEAIPCKEISKCLVKWPPFQRIGPGLKMSEGMRT